MWWRPHEMRDVCRGHCGLSSLRSLKGVTLPCTGGRGSESLKRQGVGIIWDEIAPPQKKKKKSQVGTGPERRCTALVQGSGGKIFDPSPGTILGVTLGVGAWNKEGNQNQWQKPRHAAHR